MKQAIVIYLLSLLGQSMAMPTDSEVLLRDVDRKSHVIIQERDELGTCPVPNIFELIPAFVGSLPPDWQLAFKGGSIAGGVGFFGTWSTCQSIAHKYPDEPSLGCTGLGGAVGSLLFTIAAGVLLYTKGVGRVGTQSQNFSGAAAKRGELLVEQMESALRSRGVEFDKIITAPLTTRDSPSGHTLDILGVRSPDQNIVMDHTLSLRDDGTGVARTTISSPTSDRALTRRTTGPGIKISYNFVKFVDPARKIEEADLQVFGQSVGQDWENRMNRNHKYVRYYGTAQLGLDYTVNFQIIPERFHFNDNYEDVNACHIF
ncbi:hypothetical protein M434DRAFT_27406 [Hypoxylon sp. CO27-5]|nr:hypothetical protein M434DRAFT_27406 [Hypoxylon sp. CO27-5]